MRIARAGLLGLSLPPLLAAAPADVPAPDAALRLTPNGDQAGTAPVRLPGRRPRRFNRPRQPWENGYCESFNGKLRDELLNGEIFYSFKEAKVLIEQWRRYYNTVSPPHRRRLCPRRPI